MLIRSRARPRLPAQVIAGAPDGRHLEDMNRTTVLTITGITAVAVGVLALVAPAVLLEVVKVAAPSAPANVMARTVGVLLICVGLLDLLVRRHSDSPTMRAILIVNLVLQLAILPIDPLAFAAGTFATLGSFLPNTILHVVLAVAFARELWRVARGGTHHPHPG
jgi:hypothetical protein